MGAISSEEGKKRKQEGKCEETEEQALGAKAKDEKSVSGGPHRHDK